MMQAIQGITRTTTRFNQRFGTRLPERVDWEELDGALGEGSKKAKEYRKLQERYRTLEQQLDQKQISVGEFTNQMFDIGTDMANIGASHEDPEHSNLLVHLVGTAWAKVQLALSEAATLPKNDREEVLDVMGMAMQEAQDTRPPDESLVLRVMWGLAYRLGFQDGCTQKKGITSS